MAITVQQYTALVKAFREKPGSVLNAATKAHVTRKTAKRAWEVGWPEENPPRLAVRNLLAQEEAEAAAKAQQVKSETEAFAATLRHGVRNEALDAREQEARLVKAARVNIANLLVATGRLGPALHALSDQLRASIEAGGLNPMQASTLLRNLATAATQSVRAGQIVLEIERLHRGDPTAILGIAPVEMSPADAVAEIEAAQEALTRYNRRGLEVIEGGGQTITVSGGGPA